MTHSHQRPLIHSPPTALHAHQPIILPLRPAHHAVRQPERPQQRRLVNRRPVRKVPDRLVVGHSRVELLAHIPRRQLAKRRGAQPRAPNNAVQPGQVERPGAALDEVIRKGAAAVRRGDCHERRDADVFENRFQAGDHVAGVEAAHAVGDDVYRRDIMLVSAGLRENVGGELGGALLDGARRRDGRGDDGAVVLREGLLDAVPVLDGREEG